MEIVRELLATNIDIGHVNRLGWTALLETVILGDGGLRYVEVVRLLVGAGANVNLADRSDKSALGHARERGQREIVQLLLATGAR